MEGVEVKNLGELDRYINMYCTQRRSEGKDIQFSVYAEAFSDSYAVKLYETNSKAILSFQISRQAMINEKEAFKVIDKAFRTKPFAQLTKLELALK